MDSNFVVAAVSYTSDLSVEGITGVSTGSRLWLLVQQREASAKPSLAWVC